MPMQNDFVYDQITENLHHLSDKQLSSLVLVIKEMQHERETEKNLSGGK